MEEAEDVSRMERWLQDSEKDFLREEEELDAGMMKSCCGCTAVELGCVDRRSRCELPRWLLLHVTADGRTADGIDVIFGAEGRGERSWAAPSFLC